jgi:hypothetical protein
MRPYIAALAMAFAWGFSPAFAQDAQRGVSRADLFIASFGPGDPGALRSGELAMREQVRLAFYGIDATRLQVERGQLTQAEGANYIDGFEKTIRNYIHDHSNEALVLAQAGQASDIPTIARSLGAMLSVSRQDGLLGREELALAAQQKMTETLAAFSSRFSETCEQQSFPVEVAVAVNRQNVMMGTGIDLSHCFRRRMVSMQQHKSVNYEWTSCSLGGEGRWSLVISGFLRGEGKARVRRHQLTEDRMNAMWEGHTTVVGPTRHGRYDGIEDDWQGDFEVINRTPKPPPAPASAVAVPNDAGPNARPNNRLPESVPRVPEAKAMHVGTLRFEAITVIGDGYIPAMTWIEGPITLSEKPCKEQDKQDSEDDE